MFQNTHVCICICVYIYIFTYVYVYMYVYIYSVSCVAPVAGSLEWHCVCVYSNNTTQLVKSHSHCDTPQHATTHCSALQHTAAHCNILQHAATHCNTPAVGSNNSLESHQRWCHAKCQPPRTILHTNRHAQFYTPTATHNSTHQPPRTILHTNRHAQFYTQQHIATNCNTLQHSAHHS